MKVFLSWSGDRSKKMAEVLKEWVKEVIQAVDPWMSTDIEKGRRWSSKISAELEKSRVGIICLTRENPDENWILFEAGAISKTKDAHVCTFLLDLKPTDVERPLGEFQHTQFEKEDVRRLMSTINDAVKKAKETALEETLLTKTFNRCWPDLEKALKEIKDQGPPGVAPTRSEVDMLQELLELVRAMERRQQEIPESGWTYGTLPPSGSQPLHMLGTFIPSTKEPLGAEIDRNALVYYLSQFSEAEKGKDKEIDFQAALKKKKKKE